MDKEQGLPLNSRNKRIKGFGITTMILYLIATFCAWKIGGWWGLGLVACFYGIDTLDDFVSNEYREEIWQRIHKLSRQLTDP